MSTSYLSKYNSYNFYSINYTNLGPHLTHLDPGFLPHSLALYSLDTELITNLRTLHYFIS
jgi:hypothetical protein